MKRLIIVALFVLSVSVGIRQAYGVYMMSAQTLDAANGQPDGYPNVTCDTTYTDDDKALGAYYLRWNDYYGNFDNCKDGNWKIWCFICHDPDFSVKVNNNTYSYGGTNCSKKLDKLSCPVPATPVDCVWNDWGTCSAPCGGGTQSRTIKTPAQNGGAACTGDFTQPCNTQACPINCVWNDWGTCSATCGGGTQSRTVKTPAQYGGEPCPTPSQRNCNTQPCPVDCKWSDWGACVQSSFGSGCIQSRTVTVTKKNGGADCVGGPTQPCYTCSDNTSSVVNNSNGETISVTVDSYTGLPSQNPQGPAVTQATSKNTNYDLFSRPTAAPPTAIPTSRPVEPTQSTTHIYPTNPPSSHNEPTPPPPTPTVYVPPLPTPTVRPESIIPPSLGSQTGGNGKVSYKVDTSQLSNITVAPGVPPASDPILSKEQRLLADNALSGGIMVGLQQKSGSQFITQQDELTVKRGNQFFSISNQTPSVTGTSQSGSGSNASKNSAQLEINANNVIAKSSMGLSIVPLSGVLTVETPNGPQKVSIMPDEALGIVVELKALNNGNPEPTILLVSEKGKLIYRISGEKMEKFLGLLPIPVQKQVLVSADTGSIVTIELSLLSRILSFFTF